MSRECIECGFLNINTGKCSEYSFNCPVENKAMTAEEYALIQKLKEKKPIADLINALRCLASHDEANKCLADRWNCENKDKPEMKCHPQTYGNKLFKCFTPCPFYQDSYGTCYGDGECSKWLNRAADLIEASAGGQDPESEGA